MPIYEYRCTSCGAEKEHLQKMSAAPITTCPACGQETYVKLVSAAGFQLKGDGWYVTDFRDKGSAPAKSSSTSSGSSSGSDSASASSGSGESSATGCSTGCGCH